MRKEADDTGPIAELDHWRQLTARFNALLDQIKSTKCRMVINIVHIGKSRVMKVFPASVVYIFIINKERV
jgi:dynein heavy chain